jgi:hypothetical protein
LLEFVLRNKILETQITILTPFPGTKLYAVLKKQNRLLPLSWDWYSMVNLTFEHPAFEPQDIEKKVADLLWKIYSEENSKARLEHFKQIYKNNFLV